MTTHNATPHDAAPRGTTLDGALTFDELLEEFEAAKEGHANALSFTGVTAYSVPVLRMDALIVLIDLLLAERTPVVSDEALMVLHDIAEGESTGDPEEYRTGDSMISQEMRVIDDELEPRYVEVVDDVDSDGEPIWFWIVTPAGLALLRNPAPTQPTPPAVATTPDAFWDQPLLDDAAQPEAARAKLTARNSPVLRNVKRMYNAHIYKEFSRHANDESLDVALDWLLKAYVVYDRRGEVRANLEADNA